VSAGTLYVVATPLGNLEDITARALRVLGEVSRIAAEDTRHSGGLLRHFGIHTPLVSYYDDVEERKAPALVRELLAGRSIALISDAGTPAISDPGYVLVRAAVAAGVRVVPIPGPSAVAAALSVSGLPTDRFVFEGFLPAKASRRRRRLEEIAAEPRTLVFYEAPHRVAATLADMHTVLGDRPACALRELTKLHETIVRGTLGELGARAPELQRGEVTLVVGGARTAQPLAPEDLDAEIEALRSEGLRTKEIADRLAAKYDLSRHQVYQRALRG
jgi:16S rRNA (cytidine1402-2'-O)-methyltransferase